MLGTLVVTTGTAWATTQSVTCTAMTGNAAKTGTLGPHISGCTPTSMVGSAAASFTFPEATTGTATAHWSNGKTSVITFRATEDTTEAERTANCGSYHTYALYIIMSGTVKTGSAGGTETTLRGQPLTADVCVTTDLGLKLKTGTTFKI